MNCELINKSPYSQPSQIILPKANNWISQLKPHDISQSKFLLLWSRSKIEEGFRLLYFVFLSSRDVFVISPCTH